LTNAIDDIAVAFTTASGLPVRTSYAATSTLARQIEAGAAADVFVSADEQWMDYLAARSRIIAATRTPLFGNRLVLVVPAERPVTVDVSEGLDLAAILGTGRLAVGDPAHVPVGRYAQQALTALGVWAQAEPRLVRTESARAALALVERGEVPAAIVYATDAAMTPRVHTAATFPERTHQPIVYAAAIVTGQDRPAARQYLAFLTSPSAKDVFARFHFVRR
jgi:molybdate transport system substrate-binding protein